MREIHSEGKHLVLVFDEAQEMTPSALNELKLLTNWNGGGQNFLTIILLGQPELRGLVSKLPPIDQRISLRFHLGPISEQECPAYLRHRLLMAGHSHGELFQPQAAGRIFKTSKGIPREVNRLAKLALEYAWLCEMSCVPETAVNMIVRDLSRHQTLCAA
jgi:general secretion pathway protein A